MNRLFGEWLSGKASPRWRLYFATALAWLVAVALMLIAVSFHIAWVGSLVLVVALFALVASIVLDCADCPVCGKRFSGPPALGRGRTFCTKCVYCKASLLAVPEA